MPTAPRRPASRSTSARSRARDTQPPSRTRHTREVLRRVLHLHEQMANAQYPRLREVAERFETSPRTIERDLEEMRDQYRLPIAWDRSRRGYYYTEPVDHFPLTSLDVEEFLALFLAEKQFTLGPLQPLGSALHSLLQKTGHHLAGKVSLSPEALDERFSFNDYGIPRFDPPVTTVVMQALLEEQSLDFSYHKPDAPRPEPRRASPCHLTYREGAWLLIAWDEDRRALRNFQVNRIRDPRPAHRPFHRPPDFDPAAYLRGSIGAFTGPSLTEVRLRFDTFAAPYIRERRWHPSQQLRETPAGLELTLHLNNLVDITRWILSWTPHAEALHPPELRAKLATAYYQAPRYPEFPPTPTPPVGPTPVSSSPSSTESPPLAPTPTS